jgi:hypothetical protein
MKHYEFDCHRLHVSGSLNAVAIGFAFGRFTMYGGGVEAKLIFGPWMFRVTRWAAVPGKRETEVAS